MSYIIVIGNWFVLWRGEELETFSHQRRQLLMIGSDVVQNLLNRRPKFGKGGVVAIARHLALEKLPEPLDQVQIG